MKPFYLTLLSFAAAFSSALYSEAEAQAKGVICEHVQPDFVAVDGMGDDWGSVRSVQYGGRGDGSMKVKCAYDDRQLYLFLQVEDARLMRNGRASAKKDDHVSLSIGVRGGKAIRATIFPGSERVSRKLVGAPRFVKIEDSLQDRGFSVEMSIPLAKMSQWSSTVPYLDARVLFHDVDPGGRKKVAGVRGKMHFSDAVSTYRSFMRQAGLRNRDLRLDELADVDSGRGPERILVGKAVLGVLGTSFTYTGLPIASPKDLLSVRVLDFDGSGRSTILTELRQHGNGGSRDVLIVWSVGSNGSLRPVLTVETHKEMGNARMENSWSLVPRGKHREGAKRTKGFDLLVVTGEVTGFTEANYREAPATDSKAILPPWGEQQSAVYYFEGTQAYGGQPGVKLPKPAKKR